MDSQPFRASDAISAGLVTRKELRGPRFHRLFRDIYICADVPIDDVCADAPIDLGVRSRGASLIGCVLGGWSAAELLGASCGPADAPVEIVVMSRHRPQDGLVLRHESLPADEITAIDGVPVTSALRTAYDLARRLPTREAVVAVDALSRVGEFPPSAIRTIDSRYPGARGRTRIADVLALADPRSGSPMETRIRLALAAGGLPMPELQHAVGPYQLDLAYPAVQLGVEYNGGDHLTQSRSMRDLEREAYLGRLGWYVLRFRAWDVLHRPDWVAAQVHERLVLAARARGVTVSELLAP